MTKGHQKCILKNMYLFLLVCFKKLANEVKDLLVRTNSWDITLPQIGLYSIYKTILV